MAWFERLIEHAQRLSESGHPVVLAGDYNVVPTDEDIYKPRSWRDNALLQPESRECFSRLVRHGWTDALRTMHPGEAFTPIGITCAGAMGTGTGCESTTRS